MALSWFVREVLLLYKEKLKTGTYSTVIKGKEFQIVLNNLYDYQDYLNTAKGLLKDDKIMFVNMAKKNFSNVLTKITKKTLSSFDDKFFSYFDRDTGELKSPLGPLSNF
jgi:hypothetical protein